MRVHSHIQQRYPAAGRGAPDGLAMPGPIRAEGEQPGVQPPPAPGPARHLHEALEPAPHRAGTSAIGGDQIKLRLDLVDEPLVLSYFPAQK
jgi:hypothetical protein